MRLLSNLTASGRGRVLLRCLMFAALWLALPLADLCQAAVLQRIELVPSDHATEVVLQLDENVDFKYSNLPVNGSSPARCYVDLYGTRSDQALLSPILVNNRYVSKIRVGPPGTKLRIVFDLKNDSTCLVTSTDTYPFLIRIAVTDPATFEAQQEITGQAGNAESGSSPEDQFNLETPPVDSDPAAGMAGAARDTALLTAESTATADSQLSAFTSVGRDETSVWGWAQLYSARDTNNQLAEDDSLTRLQARLGGTWNKDLNSDYSLNLHAAIDLDHFYYDADLADDETEIRLHETYAQLNSSDYDVAIGKQRVRWGKSDQLSPVDSINPHDFRQFATIDLEERALPSWLVRYRWHGESIGLETIVQPWFRESKIEYFDSNWALYRTLRQTIIADPSLPPQLKEYVRTLRVDEDQPDNTPENMSAAARLTWEIAQTDFALSYHYGWETLPTITGFPVKNITYSGNPNADPAQVLDGAIFTDERVQAEYKRQQTIGFEWEAVLDPVGFRGEIAYFDHVAFLSDDLTSRRKPVTHLVSGIDYFSAAEWYFNLQGSWHLIHDYSDEILYFEEHTVAVLGEISKSVWRGNLELALQYNYTITDQSSYLKPFVTLKYFRNLECEIGANIFSGDGDSLFGSYDQDDQVYGRVKMSF